MQFDVLATISRKIPVFWDVTETTFRKNRRIWRRGRLFPPTLMHQVTHTTTQLHIPEDRNVYILTISMRNVFKHLQVSCLPLVLTVCCPLLTGLSWPNYWVGKYENRPYGWIFSQNVCDLSGWIPSLTGICNWMSKV